MEQFIIGDAEFSQLREAAKSAVRFTLSRLGALKYSWMDGEQVKDIVGDAVAKGCQTFNANGGMSFKNWVCMIASQLTIDLLKSHRQTCSLDCINEDGEEFEIRELTYNTTPEDEVIAWDTHDRVMELMERRGAVDSMVFMLFNQGYKPGEIAKQLGLTPGAVSMRLFKTKKAVSNMLAA